MQAAEKKGDTVISTQHESSLSGGKIVRLPLIFV